MPSTIEQSGAFFASVISAADAGEINETLSARLLFDLLK